MPERKPSIGRIVHFYEPNADEPSAALVTKVNTDNSLNLLVFADGQQPQTMSSVVLSPEKNENPRWNWPAQV